MNPVPHLEELHRSARRRLAGLSLLFDDSLLLPAGCQEREALTAYVAISGLNTWANFVRAVYLSSALGTRTASGVRVGPLVGIATVGDAISAACFEYRGKKPGGLIRRRDEPAWHDTNYLVRLFQNSRLPNAVSVVAGVAVKPHAVEHLTVFRNYYSHRNQDTLSAAQRVARGHGIAGTLSPTAALGTPALKSRRPILREWLAALITGTELCCR
jgi:hypothetical protein